MSDRPIIGKRRFLKLAGMTASVAGNYAKSRLKSALTAAENNPGLTALTHRQNGERIAATLGELKGAVMKVGQMASVARDILPPEMAEALTTLQRKAPPVTFEVIADQIQREFGAPPEALFASIEKKPFASASIGQVHRAVTLEGKPVAVKVQYPGVDEAVDSDLRHLKLALTASGVIKIQRSALNALFTELKDRLKEELDYFHEAENVRFFADYYREHPVVVVPEVVEERCSRRVLTLTLEEGDPLSALSERGYTQQARNQLGRALFEVMADQLFNLKRIHADPNPANFAFRSDGKIILYDFGCTKTMDPLILEAYRDTVRAAVYEDYPGVEDGLIRCGARNLEGPPVSPKYYKMWRDILIRPFLNNQVYNFGDSDVHKEAMKHFPGFITKHLASFSPPPELVFVDRVIVGHYGILQKLGCRGRFLELVEPYI